MMMMRLYNKGKKDQNASINAVLRSISGRCLESAVDFDESNLEEQSYCSMPLLVYLADVVQYGVLPEPELLALYRFADSLPGGTAERRAAFVKGFFEAVTTRVSLESGDMAIWARIGPSMSRTAALACWAALSDVVSMGEGRICLRSFQPSQIEDMKVRRMFKRPARYAISASMWGLETGDFAETLSLLDMRIRVLRHLRVVISRRVKAAAANSLRGAERSILPHVTHAFDGLNRFDFVARTAERLFQKD